MYRINLLKGMPGHQGDAEPAAQAVKEKSTGYVFIVAAIIAVLIIGAWAYIKGGRDTEETVTVVRLKEPPPPIAPAPAPVKKESRAPVVPPVVREQEPPAVAAVEEPERVPQRVVRDSEKEEALSLPSGRLPVALHISSYLKEGSARNDVRRLREKGYNAFMAVFDIKGKGTWYRVFSGRYGSAAEAKAAGEKLKASGLTKYTNPMSLPYSLQVGVYRSRKDAAGVEQRLNLLGYPATVLQVDGGDGTPYYRLLVGAFKNKKASEKVAARLKNDGYDTVLAAP